MYNCTQGIAYRRIEGAGICNSSIIEVVALETILKGQTNGYLAGCVHDQK